MYLVFYKTNDVFIAEEKLKEAGYDVEIVPTPVQDKAYCGVSVKTITTEIDKVKNILVGMQYKII